MNAMSNNPSISVAINPSELDADRHETFEVIFVGEGADPQPRVKSKARLIWFGPRVLFINVDSVEFENVPDENKVEFLLMVPRAIAHLRHIRAEMVAAFSEEIVEEVPYLHEISVSTEALDCYRVALSQFIDEADRNLLKRGYYFHPATIAPPTAQAAPVSPILQPQNLTTTPKEPVDISGGPNPVGSEGASAIVETRNELTPKEPVDISGGPNPVPAALLAQVQPTEVLERVAVTITERVTEETPTRAPEEARLAGGVDVSDVLPHPVKKMKIAFDEKQLLIVGNSQAALGEAITINFRHKTNGEKFEIVAIDNIHSIGLPIDIALGLSYGALALTKRFSPELPLELGLTKYAQEELSATLEELGENSKWSSHINLFLLNDDYVKTQIAKAASLGYVADLEE